VVGTTRALRPEFGPTASYYEYVGRGYDSIANTYDEVEGQNEISERVRRYSLDAAFARFRRGDRILELGCGTGRDAIALARRGIRVVATDVSPAMVETTRERVRNANLEDMITVECLNASAAAAKGSFDGVYSNGAVLNLEPDLAGVANGLRQSLVPGAFAVLTGANRLSLFEVLCYPIALRPRKAFRKLGNEIPIPVSREGKGRTYVVPTRFLTPNEFLSPFRSGFMLRLQRGLQVITPPWNLVNLVRLFEPAILPLVNIEDRIGTFPGFRDLGAIFLFVLQRN
jgi:SAM-dependent methyltransferase